jgi:hypothetical protein
MQVEKRRIDIVLPSDLKEASASLLALCELFVGCLLDAKENVIDVRVDLSTKSVSCSDGGLRETLRLFVGAGKVKDFILQLTSLLHPSPRQDLLGVLVCNENGRMRRFVLQRMGGACIDWRITESTGAID